MRYYKYVMVSPDGSFHPIDREAAAADEVTRESILHLDHLTDGTGVAVYSLSGDAGLAERKLENHPDVIDFDVFAEDDELFYVYVHFEPGDPASELMRIKDRYGLVLHTPLEFTKDGGLEITVVGKNDVVQQALPEFLNVTEDFDVMLEQVGRYEPEQNQLLASLTKRQQEILEAAIQKGYYSIPREASHEEIAREVGCSASTVGEHLRKVEARILPELIK